MLRPLSSSLGGGNMNTASGLSSIGMNMNMNMNNAPNTMQGSGGIGGNTNVNSSNSGVASRLGAPRHAVHIIWDIEHVGVPTGASEVWVINSLVALAERECQGYVESFVACCHEGYLDLKMKRELQDSGVAVEEVHSRRPTDNYILTRLLALSLQLSIHRNTQSATPTMPSLLQLAGTSSQLPYGGQQAARPILIMITGERDLARALHIIRQSSLFQEIVLLHPPMHDSGEVLRQAATQAVEWLSFLSLNQIPLTGGNTGGRLQLPPQVPQQQQQQQGQASQLSPNAPPGLQQRSRIPPLPPSGVASVNNTPETRYRGMSGVSNISSGSDQSSSAPSTPQGIDENRPMGGRGDWQNWQDKAEKARAQQQAQSQQPGTPSTGTGRKSESDNWRSTPGTPSTGSGSGSGDNNHNNIPPAPYRTPYQREMARRLHPSAAESARPSSSPPSPGDVRISDERDRLEREQREQRDYYDQQRQRVSTAADFLREKEAAAWESQQPGSSSTSTGTGGGGRSRSSSTASVGGRLISLDDQQSAHGGSPGGSGSGTPTGSGGVVSYAQVLGKGTPGTTTTTITPRTGAAGTGSASTPSTPMRSTSGSAPSSGSGTPTAASAGAAGALGTPGGARARTADRADRSTYAVRLFGHVMSVCAEEKIIPRESVIRSKLEDTSIWDSNKKDQQHAPQGLKSWPSLHMEFESWLDLVQQKKACVCVGVSPQRVLWPCPPQARFECADYFRPQERLNAAEMTQLVDFLASDQHKGGHDTHGGAGQHGGQVDRGRYGFANYLKSCGPPFVRDMPRGYVVELVQLLLNKNFLQFRKGKVSFRTTAAGRWKRALESVHGTGSAPSLGDDHDKDDDDDDSNAATMDAQHARASTNNTGTSGIGSNDQSLLITSTRPGAKCVSTSLVGVGTSGSMTTASPTRAPSSSPDSSSESSSQALRRATLLRAQSGGSGVSSPMMEGGRSRAASMPSDSKSGGAAKSMIPSRDTSTTPPVGPSLDFDDPVELLAVKCHDAPAPVLSSQAMSLIVAREHLAENVHQSFFPLYHFEKSGEQHAPLWVCVITLDLRYPNGRQPVGTVATTSLIVPQGASQFPPLNTSGTVAVPQRPKRFRSTRKAKKLEAQQEAAMRAIESGYWNEAFQPPVADGAKPVHPPVVDYVANIMDDPVVILDRLLITLEQAPAVYSMESAITQHGAGSRTMWTCGVQLALRPRPAHLTTGTISMEQAENGETLPTTTSDDVPSVRYPTIKFQASQAKKFDAKGQVAHHVLTVLEKSRHRYPMLFQATPEPLPPRPKTLLMPSMIGTNSAATGSGGTNGSTSSSSTSTLPQASAPSPSPPTVNVPSVVISQQSSKPPSPVVLPQRTRDRATAVTSPHAVSVDPIVPISAAATYHAAQARAHQLLLAQQAQQQAHQQQQMLQQQQAQQYGGGVGAYGIPVVTMMPHPPPMPPSYVIAPISPPPPPSQQQVPMVTASTGSRTPTLRATATEWQPASLSALSSGSNTSGSMSPTKQVTELSSSSLASSSSASSSQAMQQPTAPSVAGSPRPSPPVSSSASSPSSTFSDRLQRIPMIRTFLSTLASPSSTASSGGRYLQPSQVVASESSGGPPSMVPGITSSQSSPYSSSSSLQSSPLSQSTSLAGSPQVPGPINVNLPNKSPSGSPLSGLRAITPPGQNLRAYVSPMGRTRPVSESALGLGNTSMGAIQWDHSRDSTAPLPIKSSTSPTQLLPISGSGTIPSSGSFGHGTSGSSGLSTSARTPLRRLMDQHDDDNMRALRRSVDDLLHDRNSAPAMAAANKPDSSDSFNTNTNDSMANTKSNQGNQGQQNQGQSGGKNVNDNSNRNTNANAAGDNKPSSDNNNNTNIINKNDQCSNDNINKQGQQGQSGNANDNAKNNNSNVAANNKNESRALKIPSPVRNDNNNSNSGDASPLPSMLTMGSSSSVSGGSDQHDPSAACHAM